MEEAFSVIKKENEDNRGLRNQKLSKVKASTAKKVGRGIGWGVATIVLSPLLISGGIIYGAVKGVKALSR